MPVSGGLAGCGKPAGDDGAALLAALEGELAAVAFYNFAAQRQAEAAAGFLGRVERQQGFAQGLVVHSPALVDDLKEGLTLRGDLDTERDARVSVAGWLVGTLILEAAIVLLAVIGGVLYRTQFEQGEFPAWGIIPYSARYGLVPWVGAVFLGSVLAQVISTGNNYLFSPATNVVHDLYHRFINRDTPDRRLLLYSRLAVVLLGVAAFLQSFQPSVLETAVYAYDVYGAGITPAVLAAFFWKRATGAGGLASILAGTATAVVWKIFGAIDPGTASPLLARLSQIAHEIPMIYPALAASLICLVGVSLLTPRPREEQWKPFFE